MGRKSKKQSVAPTAKPTCFYCLRSFDNEDVLIQHQKLLHFKCSECGRKFSNAPGMGVHMKTMHGIELKSVPKAEPGREDPTLNISGSTGVPTEEEFEEFLQKRARLVSSLDSLIDSAAQTVIGEGSQASGTDVNASTNKLSIQGLVYSDENISPEEKRAMLHKYRYDETSLTEKLDILQASIDTRLRALKAAQLGDVSE